MSIVFEGVLLDVTATVSRSAIVGAPYRPLLGGRRYRSNGKTQIGPGCWIGDGAYVGEGACIGANSILHGDARVESDARVGSGVLLTYRAWVDVQAEIGDDSVIGAFICERAEVGRGCRIFGDLIHSQHNPQAGWDDPESEEESPVLEDHVFVGWGAKVTGPVVLKTHAYVCAGAVVSKDVPSRHIAYGINQHMPYKEWPGVLRNSPFFEPPPSIKRQALAPVQVELGLNVGIGAEPLVAHREGSSPACLTDERQLQASLPGLFLG